MLEKLLWGESGEEHPKIGSEYRLLIADKSINSVSFV
jgi:hypothetical protein